LHRFCRAADDAVDNPGPSRLAEMRAEVAALYGEQAPQRAETATLRPYVTEFALERDYFEELLAALERDARGDGIADEADLVRYGEGVAAAPGQLALAIFGAREARAYARALGVALQCTNILRDLLEDWAEGRVYLPATDLAELGLDAEHLQRVAKGYAAPDERVDALVTRQRGRIRHWFSAAQAAYLGTEVPVRRHLASARAMERIYRSLASQLQRRDPARSRARIGPSAVLIALCISWWEARRGVVYELA
jgi:phytoene/squalene synthetase